MTVDGERRSATGLCLAGGFRLCVCAVARIGNLKFKSRQSLTRTFLLNEVGDYVEGIMFSDTAYSVVQV